MSIGSFPPLGQLAVTTIVLLGLMFSAPARGADTAAERFEELLKGFSEAALRADGGEPTILRRWQGPIKLRLVGDRAADLGPTVVDRLRQMAATAGLEVEELTAEADETENVRIVFEGGSGYQVNGRDAGCYTRTRFDRNGVLLHAHVRINTRHAGRNGACAAHELMHALGFPGHPLQLRSVLNRVQGIVTATEEDMILLKLLYAPEVELGLPEPATLRLAREALARQLGLEAPPAAKGVTLDR